ncbi:HEAT repeat-containing protein 1-like [Watersipora subatra]|uniref:HEAT repeat-containing protein 1-like n=1 Tax=Watersipora subatra TaxID=2589382 RepID=UPI00355BA6DF
MTSLANQLKSLALPHTQTVLGDQTRRVSLLFDPTEAANLDKDALFALGVSGLEELTEIDNVFMEYEKSLFNESASSIQRLVQSSEVNRMLDERVKMFLIHLSPYFLLRPAHKALEWLIYRYQIHLYNIDDLLMSAFPYHDTNIFTRVLQMLDLSKANKKWHWLEPVQQHGTQLPIQTVATHAYKDEGFLNFVLSLPDQFISVHGHEEAGSSAVHLATGFYSKVILNSIQLQNVIKESFIAQLATFITKGLKNRSSEYKCSSYMILSAICNKVTLDGDFLQLVLPLLTKRMSTRNGFEALSCLVFIFKTQPSVGCLPKRCFKHLCRLPGVVQHLTQLHEWGVLQPFWPHLLTHLVPAVIKDSRLGATSSSDGGVNGTELLQGKPEYWCLFESLLSDCVLGESDVLTIIRLMCKGYVESKDGNISAESESLVKERIQCMLRLLEQNYSQVVESEIKKQMESSPGSSLVEEFALLSVSSFKYQCGDEDTSLILNLHSNSSLARKKGVEQLAALLRQKSCEEVDKEFVSASILSRLLDDDTTVVEAVFHSLSQDLMLKYLSAQQLVNVVKNSKSKMVCLKCVELLSRHGNLTSVEDELNRLVLINTHMNRKSIVVSLVQSSLPMFKGLDMKQANWRRQISEVLADNIAQAASPLAQQDSLISCTSKCRKTILEEICALFLGWSGGWWTNMEVATLFQAFLSDLLRNERVQNFIVIIEKWIHGDSFYQSFSSVLSGVETYLTLNLVAYINSMRQEDVERIIYHPNGYKTLAAVISLLVHEEKVLRRTAMKLLSRLFDLAKQDMPLVRLAETLLAHSAEVTTDPLQLPEVLVSFLNSSRSKGTVKKLLELICEKTTPPTMACSLLRCFDSYREPFILCGIQLLLSRLISVDVHPDVSLLHSCLSRYDEFSVAALSNKKELWSLFIQSLTIAACRQHSLSLVSKSFFAALPSSDMKHELLVKCLDVYLSCEDAATQLAVTKLIRRVTLPAEVIREQFNSLIKSFNPDHSMRSKKMRRSEAVTSILKLQSQDWNRVRLLLEWLQNKKKVDNIELIVTPLFQLVTQLLEMEEESQSDYIKQLLLGCLDNSLTILQSSSSIVCRVELLGIDQFNMESVVQCIRTSKNPQTHQQALLLLRTTARLYPDLVLHHVMSIFTYMGANIMRQDDAYSFQIITNTLDTVVPEIIKVSDESTTSTVTGIIRVFVDAFPHIPEHRRLILFQQLLTAVGDSQYLHICAFLCVEALVTSIAIPEATETPEWKTESNQVTFMVHLFAKFSINSQLEGCTRMLKFLCSLPSTTQPLTARGKGKKRSADGLFDATVHTDKQLRHFKYESAGLIISLLSSKAFIEQFVNSEEDEDRTTQFNNLVETCLRYISLLAQETVKHVQQTTAKFWKALLHRAYEIIDKVFITSLVSNELPLIRRKAMDLLNNRLPQTALTSEEVSSLEGLVETIQSIAFGQSTAVEDNEDTTNRQTALYSLKILARIMADTHTAVFSQLLIQTCQACDTDQPCAVKANILLLIGELVSQLKMTCLSQLSLVLPLLISTLQQQELLQSNHLLWISAVTALQKVIEAVPTFLSGYLPDILREISTHSGIVKLGGDVYKGYKAQLPLRLKTLRECAAKEFAPRVLVPVFSKVYAEVSADKMAVEQLMAVVAEHVERMSREDLAGSHHKLLDFLLLALDYRASHSSADLQEVESTEGTVIAAVLKMVVKLSEASFRPMYFKLCGWATRECEVGDRLITFYRLSNHIAETLRGLFSLFASHIIKNAADTLNAANNSKSDIDSPFGTSDQAEAKDALVCKAILNCLYKCFLYDMDGFVTKERMNVLMQPLVDQLENKIIDGESYVTDHLVPCLSQLAIAAGDDSLWKPLTYQICLKTRHSSAEVRKGALRVLQDLSNKLGEDFMTLLPETIPFLAELMEDEEEEVEALCQEVIANMENMLGEPLQKYF